MKVDIINLDNKVVGNLELSQDIFEIKPRIDLMSRNVAYQLQRRRSYNRKVKSRAEINKTGKKLYSQKGTGGARHGSKRAPIFVGGGRAFGPKPIKVLSSLPKKIRKSALKSALSEKLRTGNLLIIDKLTVNKPLTRELAKKQAITKFGKALLVFSGSLDENFFLASRNIFKLNVLPVKGLNVYDILKNDNLVLEKDTILSIEEFLS